MSEKSSHVFDVTAENFEVDVLQHSLTTPVLVDFWAAWCGPCKILGPILEKLAGEFNGAFVLAKVDVDKEQELGAAFQVRSIPTVFLVKGGQIVDGFPGALPEGQLREFLKHHGIEPLANSEQAQEVEAELPPIDLHAEVIRLRKALDAEPERSELKLDLALALLHIGGAHEAERLLDELPANLATDDRTIRARARLAFVALLHDAPPPEMLERAIASDNNDLRARHLLGVHHLIAGRSRAALEQFLEMLRRDRAYENGLPRKTLIDAFRVVEDEDLIGEYRRKMSALLLV